MSAQQHLAIANALRAAAEALLEAAEQHGVLADATPAAAVGSSAPGTEWHYATLPISADAAEIASKLREVMADRDEIEANSTSLKLLLNSNLGGRRITNILLKEGRAIQSRTGTTIRRVEQANRGGYWIIKRIAEPTA